MDSNKESKNRKFLVVYYFCAGAIISCFFTVVVFFFRAEEGKEPLPQEIVQQIESPNKLTTALLFKDNTGKTWGLLGSGDRAYLGIKQNSTIYLITRDLTEGFGSYEGGVFSIKWLNNNEILVNRVVGDQQSNLIFNLKTHNWVKTK